LPRDIWSTFKTLNRLFDQSSDVKTEKAPCYVAKNHFAEHHLVNTHSFKKELFHQSADVKTEKVPCLLAKIHFAEQHSVNTHFESDLFFK
jgi:hypothetical protein